MLDLINKQVTHEIFGRGNVVNCDESYIKINFESGSKRFIFPDAFKKFLTLSDERAANIIKNKIQKIQEERKEEEERLEKEKALIREQQSLEKREKIMKNSEVILKSQSVFWIKAEESVFEDWNVFSGAIKSGQRKGQPRRLVRINQNSGCLLTKRNIDEHEKNRRILGLFMVDKGFSGRRCVDGYIPAHSKHRIRLSNEESEKMLFWNYYINNNNPENIVWKSGRHRYFDNIWMAQILRDIINLREGTAEQEDAEKFLKYFCQMNGIDVDGIPEPNGALEHIVGPC